MMGLGVSEASTEKAVSSTRTIEESAVVQSWTLTRMRAVTSGENPPGITELASEIVAGMQETVVPRQMNVGPPIMWESAFIPCCKLVPIMVMSLICVTLLPHIAIVIGPTAQSKNLYCVPVADDVRGWRIAKSNSLIRGIENSVNPAILSEAQDLHFRRKSVHRRHHQQLLRLHLNLPTL